MEGAVQAVGPFWAAAGLAAVMTRQAAAGEGCAAVAIRLVRVGRTGHHADVLKHIERVGAFLSRERGGKHLKADFSVYALMN